MSTSHSISFDERGKDPPVTHSRRKFLCRVLSALPLVTYAAPVVAGPKKRHPIRPRLPRPIIKHGGAGAHANPELARIAGWVGMIASGQHDEPDGWYTPPSTGVTSAYLASLLTGNVPPEHQWGRVLRGSATESHFIDRGDNPVIALGAGNSEEQDIRDLARFYWTWIYEGWFGEPVPSIPGWSDTDRDEFLTDVLLAGFADKKYYAKKRHDLGTVPNPPLPVHSPYIPAAYLEGHREHLGGLYHLAVSVRQECEIWQGRPLSLEVLREFAQAERWLTVTYVDGVAGILPIAGHTGFDEAERHALTTLSVPTDLDAEREMDVLSWGLGWHWSHPSTNYAEMNIPSIFGANPLETARGKAVLMGFAGVPEAEVRRSLL